MSIAEGDDFTVFQVLETPTPGPWEYVPSNENHGPYVAGPSGGDICDCYTMSNLSDRAICNGGTSKPIHFQHERADANARLIAAAPELLAALQELVGTELIGDSNPRRRDDDTYRPVISWGARKRARDAIAKATNG